MAEPPSAPFLWHSQLTRFEEGDANDGYGVWLEAAAIRRLPEVRGAWTFGERGGIKALIEGHGSVFIKPVFKGGVGKKDHAGLLGRAKDPKTALKEKERLYFDEHRHGNQFAKANGVTFEGAVPAAHEVYFSISDSTHFHAPTMTLTHHGCMDIEELDKKLVANVPFDPVLPNSSVGAKTRG